MKIGEEGRRGGAGGRGDRKGASRRLACPPGRVVLARSARLEGAGAESFGRRRRPRGPPGAGARARAGGEARMERGERGGRHRKGKGRRLLNLFFSDA